VVIRSYYRFPAMEPRSRISFREKGLCVLQPAIALLFAEEVNLPKALDAGNKKKGGT
jgi:hypothetical protein